MPTYVYECSQGHETDHWCASMFKRPKTIRCPRCSRRASQGFTPFKFTNPTRDTADLAREGVWSPSIMNAEVDQLRWKQQNPDTARRGVSKAPASKRVRKTWKQLAEE